MSAQVISRQSSKEKTVKKREDIHQGQKDVFPPESTFSTIDLQRMVADPRTARPPEILALQRKYGNEAVQRLLAKHNLQAKLTVGGAIDADEQEADRMAVHVMSTPAPAIQRQSVPEEKNQENQSTLPVQRMIAFDSPTRDVYWEKPANARFIEGINTLLGHVYTFHQSTWTALKGQIWQNHARHASYQQIHNKFQDARNVYVFHNTDAARTNSGDTTRRLLLARDMTETGTALEDLDEDQACPIQALVSFGIHAPGGAATVQAWHTWAQAHHLDYRTDSDIMRLYVHELHYSLVNNKVVTMDHINWANLGGDGNYLVSAYFGIPHGSQIGHMIGVVIAHGTITTIHDQQDVIRHTLEAHPNHVSARYIYKMP